jgi:hypothetical protein
LKGTHHILQEKQLKTMRHFGKQNLHVCRHLIAGTLHRILSSISIPPNYKLRKISKVFMCHGMWPIQAPVSGKVLVRNLGTPSR